MPYFLLKEPVTFSGAIVEAEEVIELTELSGKALVAEGKAIEVTPDDETLKELQDATGEPGQEPDDEALLIKALDDQYKKPELVEAAKAAGVEFPYDATKEAIIKAAIEQEKAEALLK